MLYKAMPGDKSRWADVTCRDDGSQLDTNLDLENTILDLDSEAELNLEERPRKVVDGAYYSGQWLGNVRHGQGRLERAKWGSYEGQFVFGKATGSGHFVKVTGDVYNGQWLNDRANGHGHYVHCDGSSYDGQWDSDLKSGKGIQTWPDGSTYEGDFVLGRKHGQGYYIASDQSSFDGQFRDDMMDGYGKYVFIDGRVYRGQWKRSRMQGDGCMEWPDGRKYDGQFKDDKKWGSGNFSWADGRAYEGQWFRGKQHGKGVFIGKKGKRWDGDWIGGKSLRSLTGPTPTASRTNSRNSLEVADLDTGMVRTSSRPGCLSPTSEGENGLNSMEEGSSPLQGKLDVYAHMYMSERHAKDILLVHDPKSNDAAPLTSQQGMTPKLPTPGMNDCQPPLSYIVDIDGRDECPEDASTGRLDRVVDQNVAAPTSAWDMLISMGLKPEDADRYAVAPRTGSRELTI